MDTQQSKFWRGTFGKEYTDRNTKDHYAWIQAYLNNYGITKLELNERIIDDLSRDIKILEVGCNTGQQLEGLQRQGFHNLYGIELQWYAVEKAKTNLENVNIIQGSGFDLPFKDQFFDLVCTNGVLIHIRPDDLPLITQEIFRCTRKYIMGFEYYNETLVEVNYRGNENVLWKADYSQIFLDQFPDLRLCKKELIPYVVEKQLGNRDCLYLLEKTVPAEA